ncbi:hypothetical protein ATCC90586_007011 [Pythium insidiosum]|nr:hypothetical protein ATCC90586_007011 [Pythium insidiosum]
MKVVPGSDATPLNVLEYEAFAKEYLPKNAFDYYASGADDMVTLRENREAFKRFVLRPRVLRDVSSIDTRTTLLGQEVSSPVCIAPTAMQCMAHPVGERGSASAAAKFGAGYILSSLSTTSLEDVAIANEHGLRWFQLYVFKDRGITRDLVLRAEKAGYKAIVLTVDTPVLGHREPDVRNKFHLPTHLHLANYANVGGKHAHGVRSLQDSGLAHYVGTLFDLTLNWKDVQWLKSITKLPVVVKGVMTAEDAVMAVEMGCEGILVSNHGARQLDGVSSTIEALAEVVAAVKGRAEVYLDGGIRRGTDVFKALALGARAVFLGRPVLWGLTHSGEEGVFNVLKILNEELKHAMMFSGTARLADIGMTMEGLTLKNWKVGAKLGAGACSDVFAGAYNSHAHLRTIEYIHSKNILYVDVKPENFMVDARDESQVYCADFGIAERYIMATGKHKEYKTGGAIVGTPTFLSLNCHRGDSASRRDDVEALLNVLIYMLRGDLPWQQAKSDAEGAQIKHDTSVESLCATLPKEWTTMMKAARECGFEEKPKYELFESYFQKLGAKPDSTQPYQWGTMVPSMASTYDRLVRSGAIAQDAETQLEILRHLELVDVPESQRAGIRTLHRIHFERFVRLQQQQRKDNVERISARRSELRARARSLWRQEDGSDESGVTLEMIIASAPGLFQKPGEDKKTAKTAIGSKSAQTTEEEEDIDPRLRSCDPDLIAKIEMEIVDYGDPVTFDDIGYSGADVRALCTEAAMGPIRSCPDIRTMDADAVRPISLEDFNAALRGVRSSVAAKDLEFYREWNAEFGSFEFVGHED